MRLVPSARPVRTELYLNSAVDAHTTKIVNKSFLDNGTVLRHVIASIETEIVDDNVIVTIRRIDEAATGPISVVIV